MRSVEAASSGAHTDSSPSLACLKDLSCALLIHRSKVELSFPLLITSSIKKGCLHWPGKDGSGLGAKKQQIYIEFE